MKFLFGVKQAKRDGVRVYFPNRWDTWFRAVEVWEIDNVKYQRVVTGTEGQFWEKLSESDYNYYSALENDFNARYDDCNLWPTPTGIKEENGKIIEIRSAI